MMNPSYKSTVLFSPPRLAEERKTYWPGMSQYSQSAVASSMGGIGLGGLGSDNMWADFLNPIHNNFMDLVDSVTGAKGQREAQQNAITLAQLQANQSAYEAEQRAQGWSAVAPWLAVGGALVVGAIMLAARKG